MERKIREALALAKKFYSEQLEGNHDHTDEEITRYYALEYEIATEFPVGSPQGLLDGWYGAISWLKDLLKFEF